MPFNVWVLFIVQALAMSAAPLVVFAGGLVGAKLATPSLSTLPIAAQIIGTALAVYPAANLSQRFGRKFVFMLGMALGVVGGVIAAMAIIMSNFWIFVAATAILGVALAIVQQFRFAAMESVSVDLQPIAVSRLLMAGIIAAFVGPEIVVWGNTVFAEADYAGSFMILAVFYGLAFIIIASLFKNPKSLDEEQSGTARNLSELLSQPKIWVAMLSAAVGFAVMSFVMTATPISMHNVNQFSLEDTKWVVQSHILAMFVPSFFSGWLISRLGITRMMWVGILIYAVCLVIGWWDQSFIHYWVSLVLLGVGWNLLFVAGTALLPQTYEASEKYRAQGFNDILVFSAQGVASLSAGVVLLLLGWEWLLLVAFVMLLPLIYFLVKHGKA